VFVCSQRLALPLLDLRRFGLFLAGFRQNLALLLRQTMWMYGRLGFVDGRKELEDNKLCIQQPLFDVG
jgi:hypothetical protein